MIPRVAICAALLLGVAVPAPASAQSPFDVTAVAYRDLAPGEPIRIQLLDDSDLNQQVRDLIVAQLAGSGHEVTDDAAFVLQVETETMSRAGSDPSLGSFEAGTEGSEIRMNLWSSREDSLLQGRQGEAPGGTLYRISLGLYDGRDGRYYWRGLISTILEQANAAGASREMIPALLTHLGKTAREQPAAE